MLSFKNFVEGIHSAIMAANDGLMTKQQDVIDSYFDHVEEPPEGEPSTLRPKTITVQYPYQPTTGEIAMVDVQVPLITLVPVSVSQIDTVKLTARFGLEIVGDELQLHFDNPAPNGEVEITLRPAESPEGLKLLIEGYEKALRAQMPG